MYWFRDLPCWKYGIHYIEKEKTRESGGQQGTGIVEKTLTLYTDLCFTGLGLYSLLPSLLMRMRFRLLLLHLGLPLPADKVSLSFP